jgi:hypothetical protein
MVTTPSKSYLLGGIVCCIFPAVALLAIHLNGTRLPMPFPILFGLFFLHGVRAVIWSLLKLDIDNAASWVVDAIGAAGFAVFAFWIAWHWKEGWSGGIPFVPESWNQNLARILFAGGGVLAVFFALRILRKALERYRNKQDDGVKHV